MSFFLDTAYFRGRTSFFRLIHLWRPITPVKNVTRPISPTFSESSGRQLSHGPSLDIGFFEQILRNERFMKKIFFLHFFIAAPQKNSSGRQSDNFEDWRLPHSSFRSLCSTFFKTLVELNDTSKIVGLSPLRSWMIQDRVPQNWCFWTTFLDKMFCFINLTPQTPPSVIHGWKATDLLYEMVKTKKNIFSSCEASDFRWRSQTDFLHDLEARLIF